MNLRSVLGIMSRRHPAYAEPAAGSVPFDELVLELCQRWLDAHHDLRPSGRLDNRPDAFLLGRMATCVEVLGLWLDLDDDFVESRLFSCGDDHGPHPDDAPRVAHTLMLDALKAGGAA